MKRKFGFLVLFVSIMLLSGCELIEQLTYREIGDRNYVMQLRYQGYFNNELQVDQLVNCYINKEENWYGFEAINEGFYMYLVENDDETVSLYDYRDDKLFEESSFTGGLDGDEVKNYMSSDGDMMNFTTVIDLLNEKMNKNELELIAYESNDESLKDYELYETTIHFSDFSELKSILYSDVQVTEQMQQKLIIGVVGKQIKYLSYSEADLLDGEQNVVDGRTSYRFTISIHIQAVGKEAEKRLNEFKNMDFSPIK